MGMITEYRCGVCNDLVLSNSIRCQKCNHNLGEVVTEPTTEIMPADFFLHWLYLACVFSVLYWFLAFIIAIPFYSLTFSTLLNVNLILLLLLWISVRTGLFMYILENLPEGSDDSYTGYLDGPDGRLEIKINKK